MAAQQRTAWELAEVVERVHRGAYATADTKGGTLIVSKDGCRVVGRGADEPAAWENAVKRLVDAGLVEAN